MEKSFGVRIQLENTGKRNYSDSFEVMGPKEGVSKAQKKIEDMSQGILPTDIFEKSVVIQISRIQANLIVGKVGGNIIKLGESTETCTHVMTGSTEDM